MRWLKGLVIGMGVLIVAGTVTLVTLIVQRLGGAAAPAGAVEVTLRQPPGTHIGGIAAAGDRVAVWVMRPDGDRVLLLEPRGGRVLGEVRLGD